MGVTAIGVTSSVDIPYNIRDWEVTSLYHFFLRFSLLFLTISRNRYKIYCTIKINRIIKGKITINAKIIIKICTQIGILFLQFLKVQKVFVNIH